MSTVGLFDCGIVGTVGWPAFSSTDISCPDVIIFLQQNSFFFNSIFLSFYKLSPIYIKLLYSLR